jgi:hypothetical protein
MMKLKEDAEGNLLIIDEEGIYGVCHCCYKTISFENEQCVYICSKAEKVFCRKCQITPGSKLCKFEIFGTEMKPHIHKKCVGIVSKKKEGDK